MEGVCIGGGERRERTPGVAPLNVGGVEEVIRACREEEEEKEVEACVVEVRK